MEKEEQRLRKELENTCRNFAKTKIDIYKSFIEFLESKIRQFKRQKPENERELLLINLVVGEFGGKIEELKKEVRNSSHA